MQGAGINPSRVHQHEDTQKQGKSHISNPLKKPATSPLDFWTRPFVPTMNQRVEDIWYIRLGGDLGTSEKREATRDIT